MNDKRSMTKFTKSVFNGVVERIVGIHIRDNGYTSIIYFWNSEFFTFIESVPGSSFVTSVLNLGLD